MNQIDSDNARSYLEKMLAILDIEAVVHEEEMDETTLCYRIECKADDARLLIGRNGQTLEALQFIVRQMCRSNQSEQAPFVVDVLDYRTRRRRNIQEQAKKAAVAVLNGEYERYSLPPMNPYERRIVHQYLQEEFQELATASQGQDFDRHIVISYRGLPGDKGEQLEAAADEEVDTEEDFQTAVSGEDGTDSDSQTT